MNRREFARLKVRFGDEIGMWPPPYHHEAKLFLLGER